MGFSMYLDSRLAWAGIWKPSSGRMQVCSQVSALLIYPCRSHMWLVHRLLYKSPHRLHSYWGLDFICRPAGASKHEMLPALLFSRKSNHLAT